MNNIASIKPTSDPAPLHVEQAVRERYSLASRAVQPSLCCPTQYDQRYLEALPRDLIERDYGCGDPTRHVGAGETVLDLGSGGGKACYIAAQVVGPQGQVIGVDMNDDMLQLANQYREQIGQRLGYHNVEFRKARIQDLGLDIRRFDEYLAEHPVDDSTAWLNAQAFAESLRRKSPLIANDSIDVVISNCVLNLVDTSARTQLFAEMFRVLRRGGRAVISDIVSDEPVPERLRRDPALWSGCISGAFVEHEFADAFANAGFYGIELIDRPAEPWAVVEGIEFRSVTLRAYKGKEGPCLDHKQAVIYRGPWKAVMDDDGHTLHRGVPMAVCGKTFEIYSRPPYQSDITTVPPRVPVPEEMAVPFQCRKNVQRAPRETKGADFVETQLPGNNCCGTGGEC